MSRFLVGAHTVLQLLWLVAVAVPLAGKGIELAQKPSMHAVLSLVALSGIWAAVAGCVWGLRVLALTGCGRWGERTRQRVRSAG